QRTVEIGVRVALGADRRHVMSLVVHESVAIAAAGVAIGLPAAYMMSRTFAALLFGVKPTDLFTYVVSAAGLIAVALAASYALAASVRRCRDIRRRDERDRHRVRRDGMDRALTGVRRWHLPRCGRRHLAVSPHVARLIANSRPPCRSANGASPAHRSYSGRSSFHWPSTELRMPAPGMPASRTGIP